MKVLNLPIKNRLPFLTHSLFDEIREQHSITNCLFQAEIKEPKTYLGIKPLHLLSEPSLMKPEQVK